MRIPFGPWLPDQPYLDNPGVTEAKNVIPIANGYAPQPGYSALTGDMSAASQPRGIFSAWWNANSYVFGATQTTLELLDPNTYTWSDVSKSGGYSMNNPYWDFAHIGDRVIAVGSATDPQYYDIGTSSNFADLAGSPPQAESIGVTRNFVVMGKNQTVTWSGYNNSEIWTPSRTTQSDTRELHQEGGEIVRIISGQTAIIFQEYKIWAMRYVGPPVIFNLEQIERNRGAVGPRAMTSVGDRIFYLAYDGFYELGNPASIGAEKINNWFLSEGINSGLGRVQCAADVDRTLIYWTVPSSQSYASKYVVYNYTTGQWAHGELSNVYMLYTGANTRNASFDRPELMVVTTNGETGTLSGSNLAGVIESPKIGDGQRMAFNVRPLTHGPAGTYTVAQATGNDPGDSTASFGSAKSPNDRGVVNFRTLARYHRFKLNVSGTYTDVSGLDLEPITGGLR